MSQPNTISRSCADGASGSFHVDESVDRLVVSSVDGTVLTHGAQVKVAVTIWAYSSFANDKVDLYAADNASTPQWVLIATLAPTAAGAQTLTTTTTLSAGPVQALRAHIRYKGSAAPCGTGAYDDHDDLVFSVQ
jgi:leucyl aminopeptidase